MSSPASLESHAHRLAKRMLAGWFREAAERADGDWWSCCGVGARPNRHGPWWGVFEEYPITPEMRVHDSLVWDEGGPIDGWLDEIRSSRIVVLNGMSFAQSYLSDELAPTWPNYKWVKERCKGPFCILDIACQHKGTIAFGIEIVHRNPVSHEKKKFLDGCLFPVFEVSSDWLLSQVDVPTKLVYTRIFGAKSSRDVGYHARRVEMT